MMTILDFLQVDLHSGYNLFWGMACNFSWRPLMESFLFIYLIVPLYDAFIESVISEVEAYLDLTS